MHRYLTADYERRSFSVSQCSWSDNSKQSIVAIPPVTEPETSSSSHVPLGAIVGGVIGGVVLLVLIASLMYFIWPRLRCTKLGRPSASPPRQEVDAVGQAKFELSTQGDLKDDHE